MRAHALPAGNMAISPSIARRTLEMLIEQLVEVLREIGVQGETGGTIGTETVIEMALSEIETVLLVVSVSGTETTLDAFHRAIAMTEENTTGGEIGMGVTLTGLRLAGGTLSHTLGIVTAIKQEAWTQLPLASGSCSTNKEIERDSCEDSQRRTRTLSLRQCLLVVAIRREVAQTVTRTRPEAGHHQQARPTIHRMVRRHFRRHHQQVSLWVPLMACPQVCQVHLHHPRFLRIHREASRGETTMPNPILQPYRPTLTTMTGRLSHTTARTTCLSLLETPRTAIMVIEMKTLAGGKALAMEGSATVLPCVHRILQQRLRPTPGAEKTDRL